MDVSHSSDHWVRGEETAVRAPRGRSHSWVSGRGNEAEHGGQLLGCLGWPGERWHPSLGKKYMRKSRFGQDYQGRKGIEKSVRFTFIYSLIHSI